MKKRHMCKSQLMKWSIGLIVLLGFTSNTNAQDTLTIEQAIATALQNNYDIQLAQNDSLIAAINYSYRNAAFLPQVNANAAIVANNNSQKQTYSDNTVKNRNGLKT